MHERKRTLLDNSQHNRKDQGELANIASCQQRHKSTIIIKYLLRHLADKYLSIIKLQKHPALE